MSQIIVVGGGLLGAWSSMLLSEAGHDVVVLEQGGLEPSPRLERRWESSNSYFGSSNSGLVTGLGGRSTRWGGVTFDLLAGTSRDSIIPAGLSLEQYYEGLRVAEDWLAPEAKLPQQVQNVAQRTGLRLSPLLRSRGPLNGADLLRDLDQCTIATKSYVERIVQLRHRWNVVTSAGTSYYGDYVVLASGTVENVRLAASSGLVGTGDPLWVPGLGDHAVVGITLVLRENDSAGLDGLDSYMASDNRYSYHIVQAYKWGGDLLLDIWPTETKPST